MKKASTLTGFSALVLASVFVSTVTAAPKDNPPDEWDILVNDVGVLVEKTTVIESDISDVQAGVDGVQGSVDDSVEGDCHFWDSKEIRFPNSLQ